MAYTLSARIPRRIQRKLAEYCAKHGVTRSETLVRALDEYLDRHARSGDAYALAADLIPERGISALQSDSVRKLVRARKGSRVWIG